ncbi:MAG: thrombospondin type 3 repeat-containing protein [Patescibacteria group bacterium]
MKIQRGIVGIVIGAFFMFGGAFSTYAGSVDIFFGMSPQPPIREGASLDFEWRSNTGSYCVASGDWSGTKPVIGTEKITPTKFGYNYYAIQCFDNQGNASAVQSYRPFVASTGTSVQTGTLAFTSLKLVNPGPVVPEFAAYLNREPSAVSLSFTEQPSFDTPDWLIDKKLHFLSESNASGEAVIRVGASVINELKTGTKYQFALTAYETGTGNVAAISGFIGIDSSRQITIRTMAGATVSYEGVAFGQSITNVSVDAITTTGATFRWKTSQPSVDLLYVGTSSLNVVSSAPSSVSRTDHVVTLNYLAPNTTYYYYIAAEYPGGGTVKTEFTTFVTTLPTPLPEVSAYPLPGYSDFQLANRLKGRILLQVGERGEAWYVRPDTGTRVFMGRPADAFELMRSLGLGITNAELRKIPVGIDVVGVTLSKTDSDRDGISDDLEENFGMSPYALDSDGDGYSDYEEIINSSDPLGPGIFPIDTKLVNRLKGRILLQVQRNGEAWYLNPVNGRRYFLGRPSDAFVLMQGLGLGITNEDLAKIPIQY